MDQSPNDVETTHTFDAVSACFLVFSGGLTDHPRTIPGQEIVRAGEEEGGHPYSPQIGQSGERVLNVSILSPFCLHFATSSFKARRQKGESGCVEVRRSESSRLMRAGKLGVGRAGARASGSRPVGGSGGDGRGRKKKKEKRTRPVDSLDSLVARSCRRRPLWQR